MKNTRNHLFDPKERGTKSAHFKQMIREQRNIVATHALMSHLDAEALELLKGSDYTLILDESLNVLKPYEITAQDKAIIFDQKLVSLDKDGFLYWNDEKSDYKGVFNRIKSLCEIKSLMGFVTKEGELAKMIIQNFPVDFFSCFRECYILTYLWEGSMQKGYFDLHNIKYEKRMLDDRKRLVPWNLELEKQRRIEAGKLITVYEGKFNDIGDKIGRTNPLTLSWYRSRKNDKNGETLLKQLKTNAENFFRTVAKTKSSYNMYTTYKNFKKFVQGRGYTKGYVSCNARGTNDYRHKKSLAYLVNFHPSQDVKEFLEFYTIKFDSDLFALSAMLQWIWRSQIRDGKPIHIYVPSQRMRRLLQEWMSGTEIVMADKAS